MDPDFVTSLSVFVTSLGLTPTGGRLFVLESCSSLASSEAAVAKEVLVGFSVEHVSFCSAVAKDISIHHVVP